MRCDLAPPLTHSAHSPCCTTASPGPVRGDLPHPAHRPALAHRPAPARRPQPRRHPRLPLLHRAGPLRRHGPGAARRRRRRRASASGPSSPTWTASTTRPSTPGSSRSPAPSSASRATASPPPTPTCAVRRGRAASSPSPTGKSRCCERSNLEKVFLTNDFDDPLEGFDTDRYVPCLRTDDLVFHLDKPEVRQRLAKATGVEVGDAAGAAAGDRASCSSTSRAHGAKACAISLPPDFAPGAGRATPTCPRRAATPDDGQRPCAPRRLLDAGRALPRVPPAVRPDDRRQPPRLPRRRLPGAGPVRPADVADPVRASCSTPSRR